MRPKAYKYTEIFKQHIDNDLGKIYNNCLIYPRQMEIHLPGDNKRPCNFDCYYCQGRGLSRPIGNWEEKGLSLLAQLKGSIPYQIYGGAYTEPLMNKYLLEYLKMTKMFANSFGIHTNGSLFAALEEKNGFCSSLIKLAKSKEDYISISLDAGNIQSHCKTKNVTKDWFSEIIKGIGLLVRLRGKKDYPAIRVCYLMNDFNSSPAEITAIVSLMKGLGVDSLRFSVPYDLYGKKFESVRKYRERVEIKFGRICEQTVKPYLSKTSSERPYVFWHSPDFQDIGKMNFKKCVYSYYQITYGADGHVYRCSSCASPTFKQVILGNITDNIEDFNRMVLANHNPHWDAGTCFNAGARCNRIALEINSAFNKGEL